MSLDLDNSRYIYFLFYFFSTLLTLHMHVCIVFLGKVRVGFKMTYESAIRLQRYCAKFAYFLPWCVHHVRTTQKFKRHHKPKPNVSISGTVK